MQQRLTPKQYQKEKSRSHLEVAFMNALGRFGRDILSHYTVEEEYVFAPPRKFRFDFAFVAQKVAVEIDGGQYVARGGRHASNSDREKLNLATIAGWQVLRFGSAMVLHDGDKCVEQLRHLLSQRKNIIQQGV